MGKYIQLPTGKLGDIAPSMLYVMGVSVPDDMTGANLLKDII